MNHKETFIAGIKSNEGLIFKIASFYTNNSEDRNDLVQEIIYQLWKSFHSFNERASLSTWMYRVAMNVAIYHLKHEKRKVTTVAMGDEALNLNEADNNGIEEKLQVLRQHLNQLNLLDKGIVMLYLENKSYQEIAGILGMSESNVGTRLSRIKEKLRKQITKQQL